MIHDGVKRPGMRTHCEGVGRGFEITVIINGRQSKYYLGTVHRSKTFMICFSVSALRGKFSSDQGKGCLGGFGGHGYAYN